MSAVTLQSLGEVAQFVRGITFKPDDVIDPSEAGAVACMRTKNVQTDLDLSDVWAVPSSFVKRAEQFLREGDILVSTANSWNLVGKCCWVPALKQKSTLGGFISALRSTSEKLDSRYLYHWFAFEPVQALVRNCARKTTNIANLSFDQCLSLKIPLPPLEEQKRIAAILDQADQLRRKRQHAIERLNQLGQAIFHEMFCGAVNYPTASLKALGKVSTGSTPPTSDASSFGGKVPFVTPGDLGSDVDVKRTLTESGAAKSRLVGAGATFVCCIGATIGKMDQATERSAFNQQINAVEWSDQIDPSFGFFAIQHIRDVIIHKGRGASTTLPILKKSEFEKLEVIVPPLNDQRLFAARIDQIREGQVSMSSHSAQLEALFASLQHRAFRGEL